LPVETGGKQVILVGARLSILRRLYPEWRWSGDTSGVVIGKRLADRAHLKAGSDVILSYGSTAARQKISGIVETGESEDDQLFMELNKAQMIAGAGDHFHIIALSMLGDFPTVE